MYQLVWNKVPNLVKKEFEFLSDAVQSAIYAQLSATVYKKHKVVAKVDKDGVRYY